MDNNIEVTYYRFLSEIKAFLSSLISDPINAHPSKFLKSINFNKKRIINILIKRGIILRNEKILLPDEQTQNVTYSVAYKVRKKDFERKIRQIYDYYFNVNIPPKDNINENIDMKQIKECDCGGCDSMCGATSASNCNDTAPLLPLGMIAKGKIKKDKNYVDPTKILGKTINEKENCSKTIHLTEEQLKYVLSKKGFEQDKINEIINKMSKNNIK